MAARDDPPYGPQMSRLGLWRPGDLHDYREPQGARAADAGGIAGIPWRFRQGAERRFGGVMRFAGDGDAEIRYNGVVFSDIDAKVVEALQPPQGRGRAIKRDVLV